MNNFSSKKLTAFHASLHRWYAKEGRRDLPWRNTNDPYAIYVSEIMLQQTQVKTVLERYYTPFLKRFPTLKTLADADTKHVLSAWQGLGYYNRAINLQAAARQCGGSLPQTVEELMGLPGIGRNTAHAVAAFAYRKPVAVMEANVKRVVSRIFALSTPRDEELWQGAHTLLDTKNPFDYNQAMMDIGSLVCTRTRPNCPSCPAASICEGKVAPEMYPAARQKKQVPVRRKQIVLLKDTQDRYYATPRQTRFLNGLYHFVETATDASDISIGKNRHTLSGATQLGEVRQQYSHFTLEADVYLLKVESKAKNNWHSLADMKKLPFSMAEQKILRLLQK